MLAFKLITLRTFRQTDIPTTSGGYLISFKIGAHGMAWHGIPELTKANYLALSAPGGIGEGTNSRKEPNDGTYDIPAIRN